jgi:hypothetical protein
MAISRVLVEAGTREYLCIGPHDAARHAPHKVMINGSQGQCSRCGLQIGIWDYEPFL